MDLLPDIDNPFSEETLKQDISLSVFSTPKHVIERRPRPMTTQEQLLKRLPGWKPPTSKTEVDADGNPIASAATGEYVREPVLPDIADVADKLTVDASGQYRQDQMQEVYSIKDQLARDNCQSNLRVIQRAILMPTETQVQPSLYQYPAASAMLMTNPFPAKKKKGKKKKGKKK